MWKSKIVKDDEEDLQLRVIGSAHISAHLAESGKEIIWTLTIEALRGYDKMGIPRWSSPVIIHSQVNYGRLLPDLIEEVGFIMKTKREIPEPYENYKVSFSMRDDEKA